MVSPSTSPQPAHTSERCSDEGRFGACDVDQVAESGGVDERHRGQVEDGGSCEDADSARADEEPDDDEHDPEQDLPPNRGDDAGDDEDDGEYPQQRGHEASSCSVTATLRSASR